VGEQSPTSYINNFKRFIMAEENTNPDTNMDVADKKVLKLAALIDTTIRFHVDDMNMDEMENNYISTWLRKEKDPLLVTILATITGDRNPQEGANDTEGS
jgi:hypothetical protein